MKINSSKKLYIGIAFCVCLAGMGAVNHGLFSNSQAAKVAQVAEVKAIKVVQRDTTINYEFVGKVAAKNEVKIMSKVAGNIVKKMVNGGETVYQGQPLFKIDNKQYVSAINSARATLIKSQATLTNTERDVERYRKLAAIKGVAQQTLDSYETQAAEEAAAVEVSRSELQQAIENEQDTLIVSPIDGRIDVNDVSQGYYVVAGSTTMGTVSSIDPIWVQFSMSENEYIKFSRLGQGTLPESFRNNLKLTLSDGSEYGVKGQLEQIDKGISDTTGTITLKASFSNPQKFLVPGMFAKLVIPGEIRQGALLVPQRAVKELLDNTFITVITGENTAESRQVKMGEKVGNLWIVEEGITAGDKVVIEGIDKVKQGVSLHITMVEPDALSAPAQQ